MQDLDRNFYISIDKIITTPGQILYIYSIHEKNDGE